MAGWQYQGRTLHQPLIQEQNNSTILLQIEMDPADKPTEVQLLPEGGSAVARPVVLPVSKALVSVGAPDAGMVKSIVLEAGTGLPLIKASADAR